MFLSTGLLFTVKSNHRVDYPLGLFPLTIMITGILQEITGQQVRMLILTFQLALENLFLKLLFQI